MKEQNFRKQEKINKSGLRLNGKRQIKRSNEATAKNLRWRSQEEHKKENINNICLLHKMQNGPFYY